MWTQLVIEVAKEEWKKRRKKTCFTNLCALRCIKRLHFSEKSFSQKLYVTSEGAASFKFNDSSPLLTTK